MINNSDLPAMPLSQESISRLDEGYWDREGYGLTKREHFAAMAMQGMCAAYDLTETELSDGGDARLNAKFAVEHADELLAALGESK